MRHGRKRTRASPPEPSLSARTVAAGTLTAALLIPAQLPRTAEAAPPPPRVDAAVELLLAERAAHSPASRATSRKQRIGAKRWRAERRDRARQRVVAYARAQKGEPYRYGATGPSAWDCSGITLKSFARVGIKLPHSSRAQASRGVRVSARNARAGDLAVWSSGHAAVYVGRHRMVDAPGRGRRVVERAVWGTPTYRRLIPED